MTRFASAFLELLGIAAVVVGFALIAPWLGWISGGLALILIGVAIDPPSGGGSSE